MTTGGKWEGMRFEQYRVGGKLCRILKTTKTLALKWASLVAQVVKNLPGMQESQV